MASVRGARPDRPFFTGTEPRLVDCMWSATGGAAPDTVTLAGEERCDVLIVGGGFNGVTAGLHLAEAGVKAILVEALEIGAGASGRNAGMVNPGQLIGPEEIQATLGPDYGRRFVEELGKAPDMVRALIAKHGIECYMDDRPVIRAAHNAKQGRILKRQVEVWQGFGAKVELADAAEVEKLTGTSIYTCALLDYRGYTIQPLAYVRGLARAAVKAGLRISTGVPVTGLEPEGGKWRARVGGATIVADKVILSTNAYSGNLVPQMKQEFVPLGAFGFATPPLSAEMRARILPSGLSLYDTHMIPAFFRYDPEGRLMVGCVGFLPHETRRGRWAERALRHLYPDLPRLEWEFRWSGTLSKTPNLMPHFLQPAPGLYATLGCNGRGIAPNTYFGTMLARMVLGEDLAAPLPALPAHPYPFRTLMREGYDAGMRIYRNTLIFS